MCGAKHLKAAVAATNSGVGVIIGRVALNVALVSCPQADLAALWQLASAWIAWRMEVAAEALTTAPWVPLPPPQQTAVILELGLCCRLQAPPDVRYCAPAKQCKTSRRDDCLPCMPAATQPTGCCYASASFPSAGGQMPEVRRQMVDFMDVSDLQDLLPPSPSNRPPSPAFELTAAELRLFALGCLGGCLEASALSVDAKGVRIVGGPQRACLLTSPDTLQALSVLHVQRWDRLCGVSAV